MERAFWQERWETAQIGFHLARVNPRLIEHQAVLPSGARVLVPLCGKTLDLPWLAQRGHEVVGVELIERAVVDFFDAAGVRAQRSVRAGVSVFEGAGVTILNADVFAVRAEHTGPIAAVWDRAALIALPPDVRGRYVTHLRALCPNAALLLVTLEHGVASGPPFSVDDAEVAARFAEQPLVRLAEHDVTGESQNLVARGARTVIERVYSTKLG